MIPFWRNSWAVALVIGGCTIESTPQSYIDRVVTPVREVELSEEEIRARLLSISPAIQRGSAADIDAALQAHDRATVIGLIPEGEATAGSIAQDLGRLRGERAPRFEGLVVEVGPSNTTAWFRGTLVGDSPVDSTAEIAFSGVFVRQDGAWRLIQGHLSEALSRYPPTEALPADDSAAAVE